MRGGRQLPIRSFAAVASMILVCLIAVLSAPLQSASAQSQRSERRVQSEQGAQEAGTHAAAGYILVGSDGGVFAFGTTRFDGSMAGHPLAAPIVAAAITPDGHGY